MAGGRGSPEAGVFRRISHPSVRPASPSSQSRHASFAVDDRERLAYLHARAVVPEGWQSGLMRRS